MLKRISTTPKPRTGLFRALTLGIAALSTLFAVGSAAFSSARKVEAHAESESVPWPEDEKILAPTAATTNVTGAALTSTSESITAVFATKRIEGWPNGAAQQNVYVTPLDPSWVFENVEKEVEAARQAAAEAGEEYVPLRYEAAVCNIAARSASQNHIVIPQTVSYGDDFVFDVTTIYPAVCSIDGNVSYQSITEIVIPATITDIHDGAFPEVPEGVSLYCQAPEKDEQGNPTYPGEWCSVAPTYEYAFTKRDERILNVKTSVSKAFGEGADFFIGYVEGEYNLPAYMEYELEDRSSGELLPGGPHFMTLPFLNVNNAYNGIGTTLGNNSLTFNLDVAVDATSRVRLSSIEFHNIYAMEEPEPSLYVPDLASGARKAKPEITEDYVSAFDEYFSFEATRFAYFGKFFQIQTSFHQVLGEGGYGVYPLVNPSIFAKQKAGIDAGTVQIRFQLTGLDRASYRFTYKDGGQIRSATKAIGVPRLHNYATVTKNGTDIGFLIDSSAIEGIDPQSITGVELIDFTVSLDLYSFETKGILNESEKTIRFAALQLAPHIEGIEHTSLAIVMLLTYLVAILLYGGVAIGYYLYAKKKYRNDEFRRMNTKRYVKSALKNFLGFLIVVSAFLFIFCRWGLFQSTIITHNPLDAFVILFVIAGAIYVGFTIRNLVVSIKNARKRKQALRLHLDQDQVDDGTK